jgi:hypothetical protein
MLVIVHLYYNDKLGQRRIVARNDMVKGQSGPTQTGPQNFVPWMGSSLYGPYNIKECIRDKEGFSCCCFEYNNVTISTCDICPYSSLATEHNFALYMPHSGTCKSRLNLHLSIQAS